MTSPELKALIHAAVSMGYRRLAEGKLVWAKPVGFTLLTIDAGKMQLRQLFVGARDNEVHVFDSMDLHFGDDAKRRYGDSAQAHFLECIKQFEAYQLHGGLGDAPSIRGDKAFHFISLEEAMSLEL